MGTDGGLTGRGVPWAAIGGLVVGTYRVMIGALTHDRDIATMGDPFP